jgi:hypothetical protein
MSTGGVDGKLHHRFRAMYGCVVPSITYKCNITIRWPAPTGEIFCMVSVKSSLCWSISTVWALCDPVHPFVDRLNGVYLE